MSDFWDATLQIAQTIALIAITYFMIPYFSGYSKEKGKNLATQQDIEDITKKIEGIKSLYAERLARLQQQHEETINLLSRRNELRVASMEKRLMAHQEAYSLWWALLDNIRDTEKIQEVAFMCQEWWVKNCLFLSPEARQAFNNAFHLAARHEQTLISGAEGSTDEASRQWNEIMKVGSILASGVDLPELEIPEYSPILKESNG